MKLYPPIYPGDSIVQPGKLPGGDIESATEKAALQAWFVRSSIDVERAPESRIDYVSIEERARAARSAWIGEQLKSLYAAVAHKFERAKRAKLQDRLSASDPVCNH